MSDSAANIASGDAFRAEFAARDGVATTASGLMYEVITEGDGPKPGATAQVEVHYHGTLTDGTVFDSSRDRGETIVFGLNQVISGWTEALQLMPVGSTYRIVLAPELAYGDRGAPPVIGANATLVFEVDLVAVP